MPVYKTITYNAHTVVHIWKIEESEAWLRTDISLSENSMNRLVTMSSELHRRGFLSIRHLLLAAGYTDHDLFYNEHGKPHLTDGKFISITHSYHFTAIIISDVAVGIDIEMQREKIMRIAPKFIDYEAGYLSQIAEPVKELTVIWGAKESMYKLYGTKGLAFKDHCMVAAFTLESKHTVSRIIYQNDNLKFDVFFEELENFMLIYILPAQNA